MYPLVLSALESISNPEDLRRLLRSLVVTYVRYSVIGRLENSLLENVVFELAKTLRTKPDATTAIKILQDFAPNDDSFAISFRNAVVTDRDVARYILYEIEMSQRTTEELEVALPPKVHVEHIYPQTPRTGEKWDVHNSVVNRIGNLTLLSRRLNTTIKNAPFNEKKLYYEQSELLITRGLVAYNEWSPAKIDERQNELSNKIAVLWAFPT